MPKFHTLEKQQTPICFTQFNAVPNATEPGCYSNVLVIQKGIAKGHYAVVCNGSVEHYDPANELHTSLQKYQIVIGDDTLDDVVRCGMEADTVKCKLDHGATVRDIVGNYAGFMRSGEQVRAKLSLMKNSPHRGYVEELFSDFANKVGNSIDFQHAYVIKDNVAVARCVKLNSVDIVDAPAATNSLFNEQENPNQPNTMLTAEDLKQITDTVNTAVDSKFNALKTDLDTKFTAINTKFEEGEKKEEEKEEKEEEKKEDDADTKLAALVSKTVLAAVQQVLPKVPVTQLSTPAAPAAPAEDTYEGKLSLCEAAGIKGAAAIRHIAAKFPALYNTKFGAGGGQKGGASTSTKL